MIFSTGKRFADRLHHLRLHPLVAAHPSQPAMRARAVEAIAELPILVVDEAAKLADAMLSRDPTSLCLAREGRAIESYNAPYAAQWMEFGVPHDPTTFIGAIVTRHDFEQGAWPVRDPEVYARLKDEGARHIVMCEMFNTERGLLMFVGVALLIIDAAGNHLEARMPDPPRANECDVGVYHEALHNALLPLVVGMGLATCRNVTFEDAVPSEQRQREQVRKKQPPLKKYRVLTINQVNIRRAPGPIGTPDSTPRAWHSVIGHYAHYGPQFGRGRLFGTIEGKFFIKDHTRGNADNGTVTKDYRIGPSNKPAA